MARLVAPGGALVTVADAKAPALLAVGFAHEAGQPEPEAPPKRRGRPRKIKAEDE